MSITLERATSADASDILRLLAQHHLPTDGVGDRLATTLVARQVGAGAHAVVGTAALELFREGALMRSVVVSHTHQRSGVGRRLTDAILLLAIDLHCPAVYLLTTTAERYFPTFGFETISREAVPTTIGVSVEFTSACPSTAIVMRKLL